MSAGVDDHVLIGVCLGAIERLHHVADVDEMVAFTQIEVDRVAVELRRVALQALRVRFQGFDVDGTIGGDDDHAATVALDVEHGEVASPLDAAAIAKALSPALGVAGDGRVRRADERRIRRQPQLSLHVVDLREAKGHVRLTQRLAHVADSGHETVLSGAG